MCILSIVLLGYMGSGKTTIGKHLASSLNLPFIDLDDYITAQEGMSIPQIFDTKGEIYFRKKEHFYLLDLLKDMKTTPSVIALGGGTPCYGNNMQILKEASEYLSFYLKSNYKHLAQRLWLEKSSRPLISNVQSVEELEDFVRKHLFERQFYYLQADSILDVDTKNFSTIASEIKQLYHEKNR